MSINTIIMVILVVVAIIGLGICTYIYIRNKSLEDIRADVYQQFLKAEHMYKESGSGKQKMKYVISQARMLLPNWLQIFITEELLEMVIEEWFQAVKDLLDDGKLNRSAESEEEDNE